MSQPPQAPPPPPFGDEPGSGQAWGAPAGGAPAPPQSNGLAIAALVCGIIGLLLSWIPLVGVLGFVLGLVAIGTGIGGIRRAGTPGVGQKGLAVGGLVTGVLATLISLVVFVGIIALFSDPDVRDPLERLIEGEDPQEVFEDLEQQLEQQN